MQVKINAMGWFDDDSDNEEQTSRQAPPIAADNVNADDHCEEDPLDAFMKGLQDDMNKTTATIRQKSERLDVSSDDEGGLQETRQHSSFLEDEEDDARVAHNNQLAAEAQKALTTTFHKAGAGKKRNRGDEQDDDDDEDVIFQSPQKSNSREINIQLEAVNHEEKEYLSFTKKFVTPTDTPEGHAWRKDHQITCHPGTFDPIFHWQELRDVFGDVLLQTMQKQGYTSPTVVQMQAIPVALAGNDALILAATGSGKTLAYLLPIITHVCDQHRLGTDETGPIALVLVPTRELAAQIHKEAQKLLAPMGGRSIAVTGGTGGYKLALDLKASGGVELVVATPGRFLDVLSTSTGKKKNKGLSLDRTTIVVLDEADKMLQMGFEKQVRQILRNIRPDRQTLMLSATMGRKMEKVAQDWQSNPVRISVGRTGHATIHVEQHVMVLPTLEKKNAWLLEMLPVLESVGRTIIFVASRDGCEELAKLVRGKHGDKIQVETLHGDKHQSDRNAALKLFSKGTVKFLIATDVAARGLDVPLVSTVVNYDAAKDLDGHIHRVGRAGRLSSSDGQWQTGTAYTLLLQSNKRDADFAHAILHAFEREGHEISPQLQQLANQSRKAGNVESRRKGNRKGLGFNTFAETEMESFYGPISGVGSSNASSDAR